MRLLAPILGSAMAMSEWTLEEKKSPATGRTNGLGGQTFTDFHFLYYTSFDDEGEQTLFGTIYQKFTPGVYIPAVDLNVRYCIQFAPKSLVQPEGQAFNQQYAGWEHVMFYNAGWEKTEWTVKFQKQGPYGWGYCATAAGAEDNNEVWDVVADYWDKENNALYLDVSRQLQWADDPNADDYATLNPNGAINILPDSEQIFMFSMGIWPDSTSTD